MRTKIIAEVASNHGGDIKIAKEFIKVAADIGVDYVKFQSWQFKNLRPEDSQAEWFKKSELSDSDHYELIAECRKRKVEFLTTVFEVGRVGFLASLGLQEIKVGSADTASYQLLRKLKGHFKHIIVSTGMATEEEICQAAKILKENFTFVHAVSLYPTPCEKANLSKIDWLRKFTPSVGYSDHSLGIEAVKIAIARGVSYIEKHFCLSRSGPGRVMPWDATPEEFIQLVEYAHTVDTILGSGNLNLDEEISKARIISIGRFGDNR